MTTLRPAHVDDLPAISAVCMAAFLDAVAPMLSDEGIATFRGIASAAGFNERIADGSLVWVAERDAQVVGVVELKRARHLAMLFVDPAHQSQGIGRALVQAILPRVQAEVLTVSASLPSIQAYQHYGFVLAGTVGEINGLIYQPMTLTLPLAA